MRVYNCNSELYLSLFLTPGVGVIFRVIYKILKTNGYDPPRPSLEEVSFQQNKNDKSNMSSLF